MNLFRFQNQQNEMLKLSNPKLGDWRKTQIFHFQRFLNQRQKSWKFAKYEGLFFAEKPVYIGLWRQKFLYGKILILRKKSRKKEIFSV